MKLKERLTDGMDSLQSTVRTTKDAYDGASRFTRMRIWIGTVLAADVLLTFLFVGVVGSQAMALEVWFEPGFPSNLLVVRNQGNDVLEDVFLVLDDRYTLRVPRLDPGPNGFEINREFHDKDDFGPPDDYMPSSLEVVSSNDKMHIQVKKREAP